MTRISTLNRRKRVRKLLIEGMTYDKIAKKEKVHRQTIQNDARLYKESIGIEKFKKKEIEDVDQSDGSLQGIFETLKNVVAKSLPFAIPAVLLQGDLIGFLTKQVEKYPWIAGAIAALVFILKKVWKLLKPSLMENGKLNMVALAPLLPVLIGLMIPIALIIIIFFVGKKLGAFFLETVMPFLNTISDKFMKVWGAVNDVVDTAVDIVEDVFDVTTDTLETIGEFFGLNFDPKTHVMTNEEMKIEITLQTGVDITDIRIKNNLVRLSEELLGQSIFEFKFSDLSGGKFTDVVRFLATYFEVFDITGFEGMKSEGFNITLETLIRGTILRDSYSKPLILNGIRMYLIMETVFQINRENQAPILAAQEAVIATQEATAEEQRLAAQRAEAEAAVLAANIPQPVVQDPVEPVEPLIAVEALNLLRGTEDYIPPPKTWSEMTSTEQQQSDYTRWSQEQGLSGE